MQVRVPDRPFGGGVGNAEQVVGLMARAEEQGEDVGAIRRFNGLVGQDRRVECGMLAIADGLTLARKLP